MMYFRRKSGTFCVCYPPTLIYSRLFCKWGCIILPFWPSRVGVFVLGWSVIPAINLLGLLICLDWHRDWVLCHRAHSGCKPSSPHRASTQEVQTPPPPQLSVTLVSTAHSLGVIVRIVFIAQEYAWFLYTRDLIPGTAPTCMSSMARHAHAFWQWNWYPTCSRYSCAMDA